MPSAHSLCQKWKRACREQPLADDAYKRLTAALPAEKVSEWMAEAKQADVDRDLASEAMDIYDIQARPCENLKLCVRTFGLSLCSAGTP